METADNSVAAMAVAQRASLVSMESAILLWDVVPTLLILALHS